MKIKKKKYASAEERRKAWMKFVGYNKSKKYPNLSRDIKNKYPVEKIHILVIPKDHIEKKKLAAGNGGEFWSKMMVAVFSVIRLKALDQTGYKLVNNGAGYNHFEHEHMHILGGTKEEQGGKT